MTYAIYALLNLGALTTAALSSHGRRWQLFAALLVVGFGLGSLNNLIEAVVFAVMPARDALLSALAVLPLYALFAGAALVLAGRWSPGEALVARPRVTPGRLALIAIAYVLLYVIAGMLVYPHVAEFYATRHLPPIGQVVALQLFRAMLFVAWSYPLLRLAPRRAPLVLALLFCFVGALAPLALDNPYMPARIRGLHAIEVGVSNFLFGFFVGWLLRPAPEPRTDIPAS